MTQSTTSIPAVVATPSLNVSKSLSSTLPSLIKRVSLVASKRNLECSLLLGGAALCIAFYKNTKENRFVLPALITVGVDFLIFAIAKLNLIALPILVKTGLIYAGFGIQAVAIAYLTYQLFLIAKKYIGPYLHLPSAGISKAPKIAEKKPQENLNVERPNTLSPVLGNTGSGSIEKMKKGEKEDTVTKIEVKDKAKEKETEKSQVLTEESILVVLNNILNNPTTKEIEKHGMFDICVADLKKNNASQGNLIDTAYAEFIKTASSEHPEIFVQPEILIRCKEFVATVKKVDEAAKAKGSVMRVFNNLARLQKTQIIDSITPIKPKSKGEGAGYARMITALRASREVTDSSLKTATTQLKTLMVSDENNEDEIEPFYDGIATFEKLARESSLSKEEHVKVLAYLIQ